MMSILLEEYTTFSLKKTYREKLDGNEEGYVLY